MSFPIRILRGEAGGPVQEFKDLASVRTWLAAEQSFWAWLQDLDPGPNHALWDELVSRQFEPLEEIRALLGSSQSMLDDSEMASLRAILKNALQPGGMRLEHDPGSHLLSQYLPQQPLRALGVLAQAAAVPLHADESAEVLAGRQAFQDWQDAVARLEEAAGTQAQARQDRLSEQIQEQPQITALLKALREEAKRNSWLCIRLAFYILLWIGLGVFTIWYVHNQTRPPTSPASDTPNLQTPSASPASIAASLPPAASAAHVSSSSPAGASVGASASATTAAGTSPAVKAAPAPQASKENGDSNWHLWLGRAPLYLLLFSVLAWGLRLLSRQYNLAWAAEQACYRRITNLRLVLADQATQTLVHHENEKDLDQIRLDVFGIREQGGGQFEQESLFEGLDKLNEAIKKLRENFGGKN